MKIGDGRARWLALAVALSLGFAVLIAPTPAPAPAPTPAATPTPSPTGCAVDPATLTAAGCHLVKSDYATAADPKPLWGSIDCASDSRHQQITNGGDTHRLASGAAPAEGDYRRLTVLDGDNVWGERCELGRNEWRYGSDGGAGTFMLYQEGQRRITFLSERYNASFLVNTPNWQVVMQTKQAEPSDYDGTPGPIIALDADTGIFLIENDWSRIWSSGANANNRWIRMAFDVTYSQDPTKGKIKVYLDLNGDGDALDPGEQSATLTTKTLKVELSGNYGIPVGGSIPDHLRVGIYHDATIACPAPTGCATELDNVEVLQP